jgi:hypothetical protein
MPRYTGLVYTTGNCMPQAKNKYITTYKRQSTRLISEGTRGRHRNIGGGDGGDRWDLGTEILWGSSCQIAKVM